MQEHSATSGTGTSSRLIGFLKRNVRPRILVLGDTILDRYVWGDVERISPEAPIPILRVDKEEYRLGGAGNVAAMLHALDAEPYLAAVVGQDEPGTVARQLLEAIHADTRGVLVDPDRMTTVKERLLGRSQQRYPHHMIRVDREHTAPIPDSLTRQLLDYAAACLQRVEMVVVSDYAKGVCAGDFIPRVVRMARAAGVPVLADPVRDSDYHRYAGCACITPNRTEAGLAAKMRIAGPYDGLEAARQLLQYGVEAAAVTMDRDGIAWADVKGNMQHFPARPRQVSDVTGAGDMVLSAIACCLATGVDYATAMEIANVAGGLEVEQLGVVPLTRHDLLAEVSRGTGRTDYKILSLEQLLGQLQRHRQAGQRIAMTNGCFDLLHPGHVASLQEARRQGDCLVVALNSDRSVRDLKGPTRPIIDEQGRAEMLAALACVDYVVIFDDPSVEGLVAQILPDVLVKAAQYPLEKVVGHKIVALHGGHVVSVSMHPHYSTTALIERVRTSTAKESIGGPR